MFGQGERPANPVTFPGKLSPIDVFSIASLCNGREETLYFFPQVRDRLAITREMPQQASLEQSIKQRIEGAPGDDRLSAAK
jgi:hypothetical protein